MKRKVLSLLLTLALCLSLVPLAAVPVHAVTVPNATEISIYGHGYDATVDFGSTAGTYSYRAATHTLTLNNFNADDEWSAPDVGTIDTEASIYANGSLNITLQGNNVINATQHRDLAELFCAIAIDGGDLTINGPGTLTITMNDTMGSYLDANAGIYVARKYDSSQSSYVGGSLAIYNATIDVTCGSVITKTWDGSSWSVSGADYSYGLYAEESVYIANSTVSATSGDSYYYGYGIKAGGGLTVSDSMLNLETGWGYDYYEFGARVAGDINVNNSIVTAHIGDTYYGAYGLYTGKSLSLTNGSQVFIETDPVISTWTSGVYAGDLVQTNSLLDIDIDVTTNSTGLSVGYTGAVSGSQINIDIDEATKGENLGIDIGTQADSRSGFLFGNSEVDVTLGPSRSQDENRSGKAIAMRVVWGDIDIVHSDVDLSVTSTTSYMPYDAYGIYVESPNYYNSNRGGDLTVEDGSTLDIETGNVVHDAGGIYIPSNMLNGDDSKISIKTGEAKGTTYSSTDGLYANGFDLADCNLTIESGEANDGCRCIYVHDDTAEKTFDNCKVSLTANGAPTYNSTGIESGGYSPIKLKNGTNMSVEVKTSESAYGIESWGGLTVEDSTLTVKTADATLYSNYGINAPSDNRGVVASVKNSTVTIDAGKAGPDTSWSVSIGWSSYKGFDIDEDSTVTVTAGGNASTQCIGMAVYDGEPINLAGTVSTKAGTVVGDDARGSFGLVTNLGSDTTLNIPGTFTAQGYTRAITGGWTSGSFGNTNIEAENILAGVAYDGSDAELVDKNGAATATLYTSTAKYVKTAEAYTVTVNLGSHMAFDNDTMPVTQSVLRGSAIKELCVIPDTDYYFPDSYTSLGTTNGITVKLDSGDIIVSGTPTADVTIDLADAEAVPVTPKVDAPTFTPASGTTFTETLDVTISIPDNATVYYTTDKSDPSETNGIMTTGAAITLDETTTLKAIAISTDANYENSDVVTATYTKTAPSSGGGGGAATPETYEVKPATAENGTIKV
ncbi:MAG: chitobiase/beta-hexosaminidase C-terminal domain-containing protein, partial [Firmicutes bacterium]|nr:chitobiase/beta-hexosaminidase C-terminal domain-containing protein [Bacillota bacterium]